MRQKDLDDHKYQANAHTYVKGEAKKIENTIIHVCLTPGSSQYNATGSNSLAKELSRM